MSTELAPLLSRRCTAALIALLALPLAAQEPAPAAADPEARLIEGELLELAEGKLDEAVEIYGALLTREDLSPALRARTLFASARAHRKRGELGAAKERYEELIALPEAPAELVEAARRTLDDLAAGAARIPEFDWVAEVEQNPQIQAQIFEWGMQLGGKTSDARIAAAEAERKLLSLGVLVVPVLEPMLGSSRDPNHREALARVLLGLGRTQHIPAFVLAESSTDLETKWGQLSNRILQLDPGARGEAIQRLPEPRELGLKNQQDLVAAVRISIGDSDHFEDDIRTLEGNARLLGSAVRRRVQDPATQSRVRDVLLDVQSRSFPGYLELLSTVLVSAPEVLRSEHIEPLGVHPFEPADSIDSGSVARLVEHHTEDFIRLLEGVNGRVLLAHLADAERAEGHRLLAGEPFDDRRLGPPEWELLGSAIPTEQKARILRNCRYFDQLVALAVEDDAAIPELVGFLMHRAEEMSPQDPWLGLVGRRSVFQTAAWAKFMSGGPTSVRGRLPWRPRGHPDPSAMAISDEMEPPGISPTLERAMRGVFEETPDVLTRSTALEFLVRAYAGGLPESSVLFRSLIEDPAAEPVHRVIAFVGLLLRFPEAGAERDSDAVRLDRFIGRTDLAIQPTHVSGQWQRELRVGHAQLWLESPGGPLVIPQAVGVFLALLEPDPNVQIFRPRASVAAAEMLASGRGIAFMRECICRFQRGWISDVIDRAERIEPRILRELAPEILYISHDPPPVGLWSRLIFDPGVPVDQRLDFLSGIVKVVQQPTDVRSEFAATLDWRALLLGEDPLGGEIASEEGEFLRYIRPHRLAARGSAQFAVQRWAWKHADLPATHEELEPALASGDRGVRELGYKCLMKADDIRWLPSLHRAAREAPTVFREQAIDRLAFFADESSLPVLTALLDDPVFAVRAKALEALETIESVLEKQEKWRERFGEKKGKKE
jgi:hypothetical protein